MTSMTGGRWSRLFVGMIALALAVSSACASEKTRASSGAEAFVVLDRAGAHAPRLASLLAPRDEAFARASETASDEESRGRIVSEGWRAVAAQRFDMLGARLPDAADGVMQVGVSRFAHLTLRVTLSHARASAIARVDRGRVVYPDALAETDRVVLSNAGRLEELLVLRSAAAPRAFSWTLDIPAGIARVESRDEGLVFRDAADRPVLRMHAPTAFDANGAAVPLRASWDASSRRFDLALPERAALAFPVVVDPDYETGVWVDTSSRTPAARQGAALAYDAARNEVVLFGGIVNTARVNDTWIWNGTTWAQRTPSMAPSPRANTALVYDAARNEVVLFGGVDATSATPVADTWAWNGVNWTQRTPAVSPLGRGAHTLAFDRAHNEVVLFGGAGGPSFAALGDTWVWNGVTWTERMPAAPPQARTNHGLAYDGARGEVILFGGNAANSTRLTDTWAWNGATWTDRTPANPAPSGNGPLAYDSVRRELVLFVGRIGSTMLAETWAWNGATWTNRSPATLPPARSELAVAFDEARGQTVLFGGRGAASGLPQDDTWSWDGTTWTRRGPSPAPAARINHALAYDRVRREVVLFGGTGPGLGPQIYGDTWTWNGLAWTQKTPATSPSPRGQPSLAFDAARGLAVLFGGTTTNDTWTWDGTTWTSRTPATSPSARNAAAMTFDTTRGVVVLFGGYLGSTYKSDLWTWDGTTWTDRTPAMSPPGRSNHAFAFDPARSEAVLFGGASGATLLRDTWVWSGSSWTQKNPAAAPVARYGHAFALDAVRNEVLLFGGAPSVGGSPLDDTWSWNGSTWTRRTLPASPTSRHSHALAADEARNQVVLFGGYGAGFTGMLADTWLYATLGGRCTTSADCIDAAACVDGVCCNAPSCGTCRTCAGTSPGRCTPVLNREDPDSCTERDGKSCSDLGECKAALGKEAASADQCASGFLVDGVCCATASCDVCQTCATALKERDDVAGHCTASRNGTDPHEDCADDGAASCGHNGTCDGAARCAFYPVGTPCGAPGAACSGAGQCVAAAEGSCDGDHTVVAADGTRTDCGPYRCAGSQCRTRCASVEDCVPPNVCTSDFACVNLGEAPTTSGGCSCDVASRSSWRAGESAACLLAILFFSRRSKRAVSRLFAPK